MPHDPERWENEFKEKPSYDGLYGRERSVFGGPQGKPERFVEYLGEALPQGDVLEVGAGQGRNALWLARRGLRVEARDLATVGLAQLIESAAAESLPITTAEADIRSPLERDYDAIVCTYVLHHVPRAQALAALEDLKAHVRPGGYLVVAAFTNEGDFYRNKPDTPYFYPAPGELKVLFGGWEVIRYDELVTRALATKPDGTPQSNLTARILARRAYT